MYLRLPWMRVLLVNVFSYPFINFLYPTLQCAFIINSQPTLSAFMAELTVVSWSLLWGIQIVKNAKISDYKK